MAAFTCEVDGCGEPAQYFPCDLIEQHPQPGDHYVHWNNSNPHPLCTKHRRDAHRVRLDGTTEPINMS